MRLKLVGELDGRRIKDRVGGAGGEGLGFLGIWKV